MASLCTLLALLQAALFAGVQANPFKCPVGSYVTPDEWLSRTAALQAFVIKEHQRSRDNVHSSSYMPGVCDLKEKRDFPVPASLCWPKPAACNSEPRVELPIFGYCHEGGSDSTLKWAETWSGKPEFCGYILVSKRLSTLIAAAFKSGLSVTNRGFSQLGKGFLPLGSRNLYNNSLLASEAIGGEFRHLFPVRNPLARFMSGVAHNLRGVYNDNASIAQKDPRMTWSHHQRRELTLAHKALGLQGYPLPGEDEQEELLGNLMLAMLKDVRCSFGGIGGVREHMQPQVSFMPAGLNPTHTINMEEPDEVKWPKVLTHIGVDVKENMHHFVMEDWQANRHSGVQAEAISRLRPAMRRVMNSSAVLTAICRLYAQDFICWGFEPPKGPCWDAIYG